MRRFSCIPKACVIRTLPFCRRLKVYVSVAPDRVEWLLLLGISCTFCSSDKEHPQFSVIRCAMLLMLVLYQDVFAMSKSFLPCFRSFESFKKKSTDELGVLLREP